MEYTLISSTSEGLEGLDKKLKEHAKEGWKPNGPVTVVNYMTHVYNRETVTENIHNLEYILLLERE